MNPTLFIRVAEDLGRDMEWMASESAAGVADGGRGTPAEAARALDQRDAVIFAPASCVTLAEVELPTRNKAQLLKAIPFTLEDELAEPVDELHFAARHETGQKSLAAVVRHSWMERLLTLLREHGVEPQAVVPETLCLPRNDDEWVLLLEDEGAVLRTGPFSGYAMDPANLDAMVGAALADATADGEAAPRIRLIDRRVEDARKPLPPFLEATNDDGEEKAGVIALLLRGYQAQRPVNLLQGDFAVASNVGAVWRRWRVAGALALALALVHLGTLALENQRYAREVKDLRTAMTDLYKESFPEASKVINPVAQMRSRLSELEQQTGPAVDYLALVVGAGKLVVGDAKVKVRRLRYRDGRIELDLEGETIERLEATQQRLRQGGYGAELRSVTNEGGRYQGRIELSGGSS